MVDNPKIQANILVMTLAELDKLLDKCAKELESKNKQYMKLRNEKFLLENDDVTQQPKKKRSKVERFFSQEALQKAELAALHLAEKNNEENILKLAKTQFMDEAAVATFLQRQIAKKKEVPLFVK